MGNGVGAAVAAIVVIVVVYLASVAFVQLEAPEVLGGAGSDPSNASEPAAAQAVTFDGPALAVTPSTFWAVSAHPGCPICFTSDPALGAFLSSTPVTWYRVGAGADACNMTLDVAYNSSGDDVGACAVNLASFKDWCYSLTPHCHSIVQLPGENNNSGIDSSDVAYLEGTIGLYPDYWAIGNEPSDWIHYDEPWASWQPSDHNAPTAVAYAVDVRNAIEAIRGVDPFARFVGIENSGVNPSFLQNVTRIDGSLISWVAYHTYPGGTGGPAHPTLSEFYSLLNGSTSIPETYAEVRNSTDKYCSNCSSLPISIGEYNGGTSNSTWTTYLDEFPNVIFTAASLTQALRNERLRLDLLRTRLRSILSVQRDDERADRCRDPVRHRVREDRARDRATRDGANVGDRSLVRRSDERLEGMATRSQREPHSHGRPRPEPSLPVRGRGDRDLLDERIRGSVGRGVELAAIRVRPSTAVSPAPRELLSVRGTSVRRT